MRGARGKQCIANGVVRRVAPHLVERRLGVRTHVAPIRHHERDHARGCQGGRHEREPWPARRRGALQRRQERVHPREPILRIDRERTHDHRVHAGGHLRAGGRLGQGPVLRGRERREVVGTKRRAAMERLPERRAERVLVRAGIGGPSGVLLGRHVRRRAHHGAVLGERHREVGVAARADRRCARARRRVGLVHRAREAEVHHAHAPVVADQHVGRLEVAMHDPLCVRGREASPGGDEHLHDRGPRSRRAAEPVAQGVALHVLHRDEEHAVVDIHVVHGHDVGMRQLGHRLRLSHHPSAAGGAVALGQTQALHRDLASELGIVGAQHEPHPARADLLDHEVAAEVLLQRRCGLMAGRRLGGGGCLRDREILGLLAASTHHDLP
jgi:hypothetical protein